MRTKKILVSGFSIFSIAFIVRLIYILTAASQYKPIFDAGLYDEIARNLIDKRCYCIHGDYSTVSRAPLWPWIISIIYYFTNKQVICIQIFYSLLGSGTCVFIYLLAKILFTKKIAFFTGLIAATYTGLFIYDGWLYSESLYTFCSIGLVYTLFMLQRFCQVEDTQNYKKYGMLRGRIILNRWAICSGLFLAAATLTRPNGSSLLGAIYLWAVITIVSKAIRRKHWAFLLRQTLLMTLIALILVVPWTYRNYVVSRQFVLVATGMGEVLNGAYNENVLTQQPADQGFWSPPAGAKVHDEVNYSPSDDKDSTRQAISWIVTHVDKIPLLFALHFENMWKPYTYSHGLPIEEFPQRLSSKIVFALIPIQAIPIFVLALLDCILTWKRQRKDLIIVYIMLAFTILQNVLFYGTMRFRAPIEPLLVLLASDALWKLCVYGKALIQHKPCFRERVLTDDA